MSIHACVAFFSPGIPLTLRGPRPDLERDAGESMGIQLRRRRRELGLQRIEAARPMAVKPKTLKWWERDEKLPFVNTFPALVEFLGYEPRPEPSCLAHALSVERRRRGLNRVAAAAIVGVDESNWWRRAARELRPMSRVASALSGFLGFSIKKRLPTGVR